MEAEEHLVLDSIISDHCFRPQKILHPDYIRIVTSDGNSLFGFYHKNNDDNRTVVFFHGNGEVVEHYVGRGSVADQFGTFTGANMFVVEYRGYGHSTGKPQIAKMLQDIPAIYQTLTHGLKIPESSLFLYGRSIGSLYALHFAATYPNIAGLIIEAGFSEMVSWTKNIQKRAPEKISDEDLNRAKIECEKHFNHKQKIESYNGPLLILHAVDDHLVPFSHAEQLFAWSTSPNKKLAKFEFGKHSLSSWNHQLYWEYLKEFMVPKETKPEQKGLRPVLFVAAGLLVVCGVWGVSRYAKGT